MLIQGQIGDLLAQQVEFIAHAAQFAARLLQTGLQGAHLARSRQAQHSEAVVHQLAQVAVVATRDQPALGDHQDARADLGDLVEHGRPRRQHAVLDAHGREHALVAFVRAFRTGLEPFLHDDGEERNRVRHPALGHR